jgi:ankyrin repeat protein
MEVVRLTPIEMAAEGRHPDVVRVLLEAGASIDVGFEMTGKSHA